MARLCCLTQLGMLLMGVCKVIPALGLYLLPKTARSARAKPNPARSTAGSTPSPSQRRRSPPQSPRQSKRDHLAPSRRGNVSTGTDQGAEQLSHFIKCVSSQVCSGACPPKWGHDRCTWRGPNPISAQTGEGMADGKCNQGVQCVRLFNDYTCKDKVKPAAGSREGQARRLCGQVPVLKPSAGCGIIPAISGKGQKTS